MNAPSGIFGDEAAELPLASLKRLARIAGVFYLVVAITGGFSEGFVDPYIYVAGDATTTAANVLGNASLMRLGVVAHLTDAVFLPLTALTLYLLLQHAGKHAARLMVVAVIIAAGIKSVDTVFSYVALNVATDSSYETALGLLGSSAIVLILLDIQHYAVLAAQVFFSLWLAPLGYLAIKSRLFPRALGIILILATLSYLAQIVLAFLLPALEGQIHNYLVILPLVAEVWMLFYLLIIGVRTPRTAHHAPVQVAPLPA
ncbi:DUF4386 domain-containing protein [Kocuria sabuli]|uniref:DUF4386 domain-containing protein n=1 Tax=Kocuria sabuli TaxID=3071448 RepID=UPI0034D494F6